MERFSFDVEPGRGGLGRSPREVSVHVLSEGVFCPRAAVLALESGRDNGEDEPLLGPRLDEFADYDEHRFVEELHAAWGEVRFWLTLLAPAALLVVGVWWLVSPIWGVIVSLPLFRLGSRLWVTGKRIVALVRQLDMFDAAPGGDIDLAPQEIREVNWWSLRKAGFDCQKLVDPHRDPVEGLVGRPWRVLTKGTTLRIPVIRKHRGERVWRVQHVVRVAAYCRLIKSCELGDSPFGVLMFSGSYDCLIIPNSIGAESQLEKAFKHVQELLSVYEGGKFIPREPTDNRCNGCHWGKPCVYVAGKTDTILNGKPVIPLRTRAGERYFHSACGDRFQWVPPHDDAVALGIAEPRD